MRIDKLNALMLAGILILWPTCALASMQGTVRIPGPGGASANGAAHTFAAPSSANNRCYNNVSGVGSPLTCTLTTAPASGSLVTAILTVGFGGALMTTCTDGTHVFTTSPASPSNVKIGTALSVGITYWYATI